MTSIASHVFWRQGWNTTAEPTLAIALAGLNLRTQELNSQTWDFQAGTIGETAAAECVFFAPAAEGWSGLQLPLGSPLGEPLAEALSRQSNGIVLLVREVGQTWGYWLYDQGRVLDRFWSMPSMVDVSPESAMGGPSRLSEAFGIPAGQITPYLNHLSPDEVSPARAFPDDEFALGDPWVRVDFLRRLGLSYPRPFPPANGRFFQWVPLTSGPLGNVGPGAAPLDPGAHPPPTHPNSTGQFGHS